MSKITTIARYAAALLTAVVVAAALLTAAAAQPAGSARAPFTDGTRSVTSGADPDTDGARSVNGVVGKYDPYTDDVRA